MDQFIKLFYSFAVGVALAVFAGYAVSAINPGVSWQQEQKCYETTRYPETYDDEYYESDEFRALQAEEEACYDELTSLCASDDQTRVYYLLVAVALLGGGYIYMKRRTSIDSTLSDGVGFGMAFTAFYALTTTAGFAYNEEPNTLLNLGVATILLVSTILVTYYSFIAADTKPNQKKAATKKRSKM